jgi:AraC-like DNA-binding protein
MAARSKEWMKYVAAPSLGVQALHAHFNKHEYERHSHDYFVLGTIDAGAPKVSLENQSFIAPAGSAMIINPGEAHDGRPCDESGYIYSMVYVEPWIIGTLAEEHGIRLPQRVAFTNPVITDPDIVLALQRLHRKVFSAQDPLASETSLIDAISLLLQRFSTEKAATILTTSEPRIERVRELIHAGFSTQLTTSVLAEAASLSRVRLNQLFSAAYGLPLHAYVNTVRMEAAKALLIKGYAAADVATSVGLSDQSHLIRRFKGSFGITPAQFTAAHLSDIQYSS